MWQSGGRTPLQPGMPSGGGTQPVATDARASPSTQTTHTGIGGRAGIEIVAASYVAYLALLVTCDVRRVAPIGFVPSFQTSGVIVTQVQPESPAASAGLFAGDRIKRANGQVLEGPADWQRVRVHLDPSIPMTLEIDRDGRSLTVSLRLRSGLAEWRSGQASPALAAFRAAQVITLAFAIVVAFKRYSQPSALLGAMLLGSVATVSLALPMRLAAFWHALPAVLAAFVWIPFATSAAVGPLLFAFFVVFPRHVVSMRQLGVMLAPASLLVGWHVVAWHQIMQDPGPPTGVADRLMGVFAINAIYAALALGVLVLHSRTAQTLTDARRIRVLIAGAGVGGAAGTAVVVGHAQNPGADIFASRELAVLSLGFLAVPASFAYAILRHRLFDFGLIVRQGLRYALARGLVGALIPVLAAVLVADVIVHRQQPLLVFVRTRWWWFSAVGTALLVVLTYRERWLNSIDRHFFRERYDALR